MNKKNILYKTYRSVINSIAFYPLLMVLLSVILALFILYIEYTPVSEDFKQIIQVALVTNAENARMILTTIVGGIISLTVFSFSMVMVVLNRASATLSPRVIPGIISRKSHQFVLGFYISTIIFSLLIIINVNAVERGVEVPSLGIFLSMLMSIICLGLFIFFIDSISKSIQVDNILEGIFRSTERQLLEHKERSKDLLNVELKADEWEGIPAEKSGYFNEVQHGKLKRILADKDSKLRINIAKGDFIPKGYPYISISNSNYSEEQKIKIRESIVLEEEEHYKEHFNFGFKQITEIASKALSPGINDPGTASKAINLLTVLLIIRMKSPDHDIIRDDDGNERIIIKEKSFSELMTKKIGTLREYGKRDIFVMIELMDLIKDLYYADKEKQHQKSIVRMANSIIQDVKMNNKNELDVELFNEVIVKLNDITEKKFSTI